MNRETGNGTRNLCADGADPSSGALHAAAARRDVAVCRALLAAGADCARQDDDGNCPFHKATAAAGRNLCCWQFCRTVLNWSGIRFCEDTASDSARTNTRFA